MPNNERMENEGRSHGGYAGKNSGSSNHRGGKKANKPKVKKTTRADKSRNSGSANGASSMASPEIRKAVYLTAIIPVVAIVSIASYFTAAAFGAWN